MKKNKEGTTMKKIISTLIIGLFALNANAQVIYPDNIRTDKIYNMNITLKDGRKVSYQKSEIDHITFVSNVGMKIYLKAFSTTDDYLYSQMSSIEYPESEPDASNANANWNSFELTGRYAYAWGLEYPQLNSNTTDNEVVVKQTDGYGVTYSLEWDNAKIANRWTCYTMHAGNNLSNTDRNDDFKADPDVTTSAQLSDYKNSGFSRGHLCPSLDRQCSVEQNKQTFFLTNMQPQWQKHNGGLWKNLEDKVNTWSRTGLCDTIYVVKAATIANVNIGGAESAGVYAEKCNNRLLVPKYFYMAILGYNKSQDTYHALGLWTEHADVSDTNKNYGDYAITIDELERRTGIDFFCNLPDEIENDVEASISDLTTYWGLTKTNP